MRRVGGPDRSSGRTDGADFERVMERGGFSNRRLTNIQPQIFEGNFVCTGGNKASGGGSHGTTPFSPFSPVQHSVRDSEICNRQAAVRYAARKGLRALPLMHLLNRELIASLIDKVPDKVAGLPEPRTLLPCRYARNSAPSFFPSRMLLPTMVTARKAMAQAPSAAAR